MEKHFVTVKLNLPMHRKKAGAVLKIETDAAGTPLVKEWRNRFKDARVGVYAVQGQTGDGCLETREAKVIKIENGGEDQ